MTDLSDQTKWDEPILPVTIVADAAGIDVGSLRKWILRASDETAGPFHARGDVTAPGGIRGRKGGSAHLFTFRATLMVCCAARLTTAKGTKVEDSLAAASQWTHRGSGQGGFIADSDDPSSLPYFRAPAGLYPPPDITLLVHRGGPSARVIRAGAATNEGFVMLPASLISGDGASTVVNLNEVSERAHRVCSAFLEQRKAA